jgi:hypothetical protein
MKDSYEVGLEGKELQIYMSLCDYRDASQHPGGILLTSGPTEIILRNSRQLNKRDSETGKKIFGFFESNIDKQLIYDECYHEDVLKLYDILSKVDGAANLDDGYLTTVKRCLFVDRKYDMDIDGGTRHIAGAYASTLPSVTAFVLSEESDPGAITVFRNGKEVLRSLRNEKTANCMLKAYAIA